MPAWSGRPRCPLRARGRAPRSRRGASEAPRGCPAAGSPRRGDSELRGGPEILVRERLGWNEPAGEVLPYAGPTEERRAEARGRQKPGHQERGAADEVAGHRHPAEHRPREPEGGQRAESDHEIAI